MRSLKVLLVGFIAGLAAILVVMAGLKPREVAKVPDPPALVEKIREVAKLETLEVSVYKKVSYEPVPPVANSFVGELANWASYTWDKPEGKAIVFANVHLGLDLSKLDDASVRVEGDIVEIVLPPIQAMVEIKPGETEIVRSNLEPADMMQMLEEAKWAIEGDIAADAAMQDRARASAKRAIRAFLQTSGYRDVIFIDPESGAS